MPESLRSALTTSTLRRGQNGHDRARLAVSQPKRFLGRTTTNGNQNIPNRAAQVSARDRCSYVTGHPAKTCGVGCLQLKLVA
jgi:hypothetical protein